MQIGDKVTVNTDKWENVGTVENIGIPHSKHEDQVYVRWHRGYASWVPADDLSLNKVEG